MTMNRIGTGKLFRCVCGLLVAALMLSASAVSCGKPEQIATGSASEESYVFEDEETGKSLLRFLDNYCKWYAASPYGDWDFDSSRAADGDGNILACIASSKPCVDWSLYSDRSMEDRFVENPYDPRGWAAQSNAYYVFDEKTVEFIAREIFNLSEGDIDRLAISGEIKRLFYRQNEKYYTISDDNLQSLVEISSVFIRPAGDRYTVTFIASGVSEQNDEGLVRVEYHNCTAEMALKTIHGREYWTLYRFDSKES